MILKEQQNKQVYSDGEVTEKKMLDIAKEYPEDLSQDYISDNSEYTLNNTFSSVRHNILNWYPFNKDADILEVGAGMGSITGMLCDVAKSVTALEMSSSRADVIRARYPERTNLEIVSADITQWECEKRYDYVIAIGVLEYAAVFSDHENPFVFFLECLRKFLKKDGRVLFAIENRFGLKYWVGGSEDHLQKPFAGLEGYLEPGTPKTFSKKELEMMASEAGFAESRFYYIYPDYKFPEVVFTDEFKPSYTALQKVSFTYSKNSILSFDEKKVYKDLIENDVWQFFANSYLVEAANEVLGTDEHVIHVSARGEAKKEYRVSTVIKSDGRVYKVPMHPKASAHMQTIKENTEYLKKRGIKVVDLDEQDGMLVYDFINEIGAQSYFNRLLAENNRKDLFAFIELLRSVYIKTSELEYKENILFDFIENLEGYNIGPVLKKGFIDLTLYNSFYVEGDLLFYDQEWCFDNIPLNFMLYYTLKSAYFKAQADTSISFEELLNYCNIGAERELFSRLEDYIWSKVLYRQTDFYGDGGYCNRFSEEMTVKARINSLEAENGDLQRQNQSFECKNIELENHSNELEAKHNELEARYADLQVENNKFKRDIIGLQDELTEKTNTIISIEEDKIRLLEKQMFLEQEVKNKLGHIDLLLPAERELIHIKNSKMFKVMRLFCRGLDILLWIPNKGYAAWKILKRVNIPKLKIAAGYVKNEGFADAYRHLMRDYHQGQLKQINIELQPDFNEIVSLDECEKLTLPLFENPTVSIVIPVYNQFTYTYNCIKSIIENSGDVTYEVILADDCSTDLTQNITLVIGNLIVVKTETNLRFLRNCNNAAKSARGSYVLFLNNDTQVQNNWLRPLVDLCERDAAIGMVGSKLVYSDGSLQEAGGIIWKDGSGWNYGRNDDAMKPEYCYVREVDYISGASIMIRRSLWEDLGGFDEYFAPAYCEDSDLAFQVRSAGYKVVYQPLSVVVHFEGKSNGTDLSSGVKKYQVENNLKLRKKWKDEFAKLYDNGQNVFKARERGQNKKTILVIDHYVPQFDKDAGSKTTYQYLKMFVEQGYLVKFMGDNFYQDEPYTTVLQQMGVEVLYGPWYAQHWKEWIKDNQRFIDFVYLNRPHITMNYIDFLKKETNIKCIYYGHDLHFLRLKREYELTGNTEKLKESEEWMEKELYIMRKADISYYPSCIEEQAINEIDSTIPVKAITAYVYDQFREKIPADFAKREGIMFVGGFGHPPNEDAVLWFVENVYPIISEKEDIPFYIIGSKATERIKKLHGGNIIVKGFVSEEELNELYDTCKLVVVPLRYGAGVKGKVVEALYYGTPMVTTSVGAEGIEGVEEIIEIADEAEVFAKSVIELYNNDQRLREISEKYQKFIKDKFSIDAVWNIVKEDFN